MADWQMFRGQKVKVRIGPIGGDDDPLYVEPYVHTKWSISDAVAIALAKETHWEDVLSATNVMGSGGPTAAMLARLEMRGGSYTYVTMAADINSAFHGYAVEMEVPEPSEQIIEFFRKRKERTEEADDKDSKRIYEGFDEDLQPKPKRARSPLEEALEEEVPRQSSPSLVGSPRVVRH